MTITSNLTTTQNAVGSHCTTALTRPSAPNHPSNSATSRLGGVALRLLDALLRSLAAPHI
jgi:hypothetical protein